MPEHAGLTIAMTGSAGSDAPFETGEMTFEGISFGSSVDVQYGG
ncbi:hypothetical protein [Limimaricola cinnabarinus]